jgi:phosphoribosylglycinamide formyltransferase 2
MNHKIMILGSGELGKEFIISAQRLGISTVAVDNYENAPAMHVADDFEVLNMLDGKALEKAVQKHKPTIIVPEVESIRTSKLFDFEKAGIQVVPTPFAADVTMDREKVRDLASKKLNLKTAKYVYASSKGELIHAVSKIGAPCIVKPLMSSSGKGQSLVKKQSDAAKAWDFAVKGMRGDVARVIVEEFIKFESEITLLTVKQKKGPVIFVKPIGHRQEEGDYRESWLPAKITKSKLKKAQTMAEIMVKKLGGAGLFGVEFFITKSDVYFSELSPRPHDTGMVTMISQNLSEFDLHLRAILGLPIPKIKYEKAGASAVILADRESSNFSFKGVDKALINPDVEVRVFGKPTTRKNRRMGVALAVGKDVKTAVKAAVAAAKKVKIVYS